MIKILLSLLLVTFAAEDSKLVKAVNQGDNVLVEKLAKDKKELNWKDESGFDALFYAVSLNNEKTVEVLLKAGASTKESYTDKKESLLFEAARLGGEKVAQLIIKKDPSILKRKNSLNESPLAEATKEGQTGMVKLLKSKGLAK